MSTTTRLADRSPDSKLKDFAIHISEIDLPTGRTPDRSDRHPQVSLWHCRGIPYHEARRLVLPVHRGGRNRSRSPGVVSAQQGRALFGAMARRAAGSRCGTTVLDEEVQRTSHADLFEDGQGRWWEVFLGVRPVKQEGEWLEPQLGTCMTLLTGHSESC